MAADPRAAAFDGGGDPGADLPKIDREDLPFRLRSARPAA
jgi:hypothetical protein